MPRPSHLVSASSQSGVSYWNTGLSWEGAAIGTQLTAEETWWESQAWGRPGVSACMESFPWKWKEDGKSRARLRRGHRGSSLEGPVRGKEGAGVGKGRQCPGRCPQL